MTDKQTSAQPWPARATHTVAPTPQCCRGDTDE